jgi:hypothetical protein
MSGPSHHRRPLFVVLLVLYAAACGGSDGAATDRPEPVELAPEPVVSIGGGDSRAEYAFARVTGGVLLADARGFVLLETQAREVRRYGPGGEHIATFGRAGAGPGEFGLPVALAPAMGDSVHVWDLQQRRLTTLSTEDGGVRMQDFGQALSGLGQALANLQGILKDGTLVVRNVGGIPPPSEVSDGIHRFPVELVALTPSGPSTDGPLAVMAGDETFYLIVDGRPHVPIFPVAPIWGLTSPGAARGERVVFGSTERVELALLDARGDSVSVLSSRATGRPVEAAEVDSLRDLAFAGLDAPGFQSLPPAARTGVVEPQRERIRRAPARQITPVFDVLRIDSDERTWVRLVGPRFAPTATWLVYDRDGEPLGAVTTPADFQFLDARGSRLLVVRLDALDVPLVEVWEVLWR